MFGLMFGLFGAGFIVVCLIRMAVFALPVLIALEVGRFASGAGAAIPGTIVVGSLAGVTAFVVAQRVTTGRTGGALRVAVCLVFATPAAIAGYHLVLGLARLGGARDPWLTVFAIVGAALIAGAAVSRLTNPLGRQAVLIGGGGGLRIESRPAR